MDAGAGAAPPAKGIWKENDAESRETLEPAIVTQSQRAPDYT
jgi:hypothetical protein